MRPCILLFGALLMAGCIPRLPSRVPLAHSIPQDVRVVHLTSPGLLAATLPDSVAGFPRFDGSPHIAYYLDYGDDGQPPAPAIVVRVGYQYRDPTSGGTGTVRYSNANTGTVMWAIDIDAKPGRADRILADARANGHTVRQLGGVPMVDVDSHRGVEGLLVVSDRRQLRVQASGWDVLQALAADVADYLRGVEAARIALAPYEDEADLVVGAWSPSPFWSPRRVAVEWEREEWRWDVPPEDRTGPTWGAELTVPRGWRYASPARTECGSSGPVLLLSPGALDPCSAFRGGLFPLWAEGSNRQIRLIHVRPAYTAPLAWLETWEGFAQSLLPFGLGPRDTTRDPKRRMFGPNEGVGFAMASEGEAGTFAMEIAIVALGDQLLAVVGVSPPEAADDLAETVGLVAASLRPATTP